jgi:hypothetical protein
LLAKNAEFVAVRKSIWTGRKKSERNTMQKSLRQCRSFAGNPEIEAVYIASPVIYQNSRQSQLQERQALCWLKSGSVYLRRRRGGSESLQQNGVLGASGLMMRYHGLSPKDEGAGRQGKLGQIVSCRAQLTCGIRNIPGAWRQVRSQSGGGAMMDMAVSLHRSDPVHYRQQGNKGRCAGGDKELQLRS